MGQKTQSGGEDAHLSVLQVEAEDEARALVEELPPAIVVRGGQSPWEGGFIRYYVVASPKGEAAPWRHNLLAIMGMV